MPTLPTKISTSLGADDGQGSSYTDVSSLHTSAIENMPGDFASMDSATHNLNYSFNGSGDDNWRVEIGIRDSLDLTMLAGNTSTTYITLYNNTADAQDHYSGPTAFPYVNTSATKAMWDRATLYVNIVNTRNMSGDGITLILDRFELGGTYSTSGITVTVGQASETDTSQAVAHTHSARAVGQSSETDSAQVVTPTSGPIVVNVGQASTTASAQPVSHAHSARAVGQASTTATSQPVAHVHSARLVGQASTTDTAQPVSGLSTVAVGQAVETDSAQPVTPIQPQFVNVGQSYEDNFGLAVTIPPTRLVNLASTTATAQPVTAVTAGETIVAVAQVREFDYASPTIAAPSQRSKVFVAHKPLDLSDDTSDSFNTDSTEEVSYAFGPSLGKTSFGTPPTITPFSWESSSFFWIVRGSTVDEAQRINASTMAIDRQWATPGTDFVEGGIAVDPDDGTIWISNRFDDTIYQCNATTGAVLDSFAAPGTASKQPKGIAFQSDGTLWLVDNGDNKIYELNKATGATVNSYDFDLAGGGRDLSFDSNDDLWVANDQVICKIDPANGNVLETHIASWFSYLDWLGSTLYGMWGTDFDMYSLQLGAPLTTNVDTIQKLTVTAELQLQSERDPGDDTYDLTVRIMNGATVLAAATSGGTAQTVIADVDYHQDDHTFGPVAFDYVNNAADILDWMDATLELGQVHTQNGAADLNKILTDYVELEFLYTLSPIVVAVGQASTTDTAQVVTPTQPGFANQASETDSAQPITIAKTVAIGQAVESAVAQAVSSLHTVAVGLAAETDTPLALTVAKTLTLAQAVEADIAQPVASSSTAPEIDLRPGELGLSNHVHSPRTDVDMDPGPGSDGDYGPLELTSLWGNLEAR